MVLCARKVGIVGVGHVGAHVANSILMQGLADELYLCDIDAQKTAPEKQDLSDAMMFCPYNAQVFDCQDRYEELAGCDIVVNAAGKVALAAESRDGELFFTTDACRSFANRIVDAGFEGVWVTIANPCDVVATAFWKLTGYDPSRIIGTGTALDSARLRYQIANAARIDPKSVDAYMIGEHGFSGLSAWSCASIAGKSRFLSLRWRIRSALGSTRPTSARKHSTAATSRLPGRGAPSMPSPTRRRASWRPCCTTNTP